jgi:hypothetical protein
MPKIEATRTFGVGISSAKRYMATYRGGRSLVPKKRPGSKPRLECESARKLLEANLKEHPEATPCPRGVSSLAAGCAGWRSATPPFPGSSSAWASVEKRSVGASERDEFLRAAWRLMVAEGIHAEQQLVFVDECSTNTSLAPLCRLGRLKESEHFVWCHATGGRT